ncbi:MAG: LOG family protein [Gemmataceae bacterium]|nr:LOG family protein [Gemmataceae bacterium]
MLTWAQLKILAKPIGFLNVAGFFDPLLAWIDRAVADGFIQPKHRALVRAKPDVEPMLDTLFP